MTPDIVVDIGNSRMKWGRVADGKVVEMVSLSLADEEEWDDQIERWKIKNPIRWVMAGVNPTSQRRFESWAQSEVKSITSYQQIPITVAVEHPEQVGIDRLLNAVAAKSNEPTIVISVGTAVTIDLIDGKGIFRGGAIFPGPRLMAKSLSQNTAALPEIVLTKQTSPLPGKNTVEAIRTGVYWAIIHAINGLCASFAYESGLEFVNYGPIPVVLTGGDSNIFEFGMEQPLRSDPKLTLEGIRLVAEQMF